MFKTKEEVMLDQDGYESFGTGVDDAFKSFAERIEFYKKYKISISKFLKDYPEFKEELDIYIIEGAPSDIGWHVNANRGFCDWLFDYCFGDVINAP